METEKCVVCNKDTGIPVTTDVTHRPTYIEGGGQLCGKCYNDIYGNLK